MEIWNRGFRHHLCRRRRYGNKFDKSIDNDNIDAAKHYYKELNLMLHPSNPLRKMLEIEMIGVDSND